MGSNILQLTVSGRLTQGSNIQQLTVSGRLTQVEGRLCVQRGEVEAGRHHLAKLGKQLHLGTSLHTERMEISSFIRNC